jgi:hypothetical protein
MTGAVIMGIETFERPFKGLDAHDHRFVWPPAR